MILERSDFAELKLGKEPKDGGGKTVVCNEKIINPYTSRSEPPRSVLMQFCWKERLVNKKITKNYDKLLKDTNWYYEQLLRVEFVNLRDKQFLNKVRVIYFNICNEGHHECPGKTKNYLKISSDEIQTKNEAESGYLEDATLQYTWPVAGVHDLREILLDTATGRLKHGKEK